MQRFILALTAMALCMGVYGCTNTPDSGQSGFLPSSNTNPPPSSTKSEVTDTRPAAIVNGRALSWNELRPILSEYAGADALTEAILDRFIHEAAVERGIAIGPNEIDAERKLLLESLNSDPNTAMRLLNTLRDRQGLGRVRFENLLRRNAALRAMVRDRLSVTEADIQQMHEIVHGPKRQPRLIVVPTLADARRTLARIEAGEPFMDIAVEISTDASAPRGGLLEPISMADPSYPESLRGALWQLDPGRVSPPILLEGQYALLTLVREIPADHIDLETARSQLHRQVRLNRERLQMDQLARNLMSNVSITIFDDTLHEAWKRRE